MILYYRNEKVNKHDSLIQAGITADAKLYVNVEHEDDEAQRLKAEKEAKELEE